MTLSFFSVFDLSGSAFFGLYIGAFFLALAWSVWRRLRANDKFSLPGAAETQLTDPYEIAFLAGGAPRCAQVAAVKLITCEAVDWKRAGVFKESRLVASGHAEAGFNEIERTLFSSILSYGKKGMPVAEIPALIATRLSGIEARLAKLGLRPTASESNGRGCYIMLPILILMFFGVLKVCLDLSRGEPVVFLVILMFITFFIVGFIAVGTKALTPAGEELLARMRAGKEAQGDVLHSVALFGAAWTGDPRLAGLDSALRKDISQMGRTNSSSGCGTSGCSSGCGGGGCGGCGGD